MEDGLWLSLLFFPSNSISPFPFPFCSPASYETVSALNSHEWPWMIVQCHTICPLWVFRDFGVELWWTIYFQYLITVDSGCISKALAACSASALRLAFLLTCMLLEGAESVFDTCRRPALHISILQGAVAFSNRLRFQPLYSTGMRAQVLPWRPDWHHTLLIHPGFHRAGQLYSPTTICKTWRFSLLISGVSTQSAW